MVTLRPHGPGRFFAAAFLGVWLCGWAFGEGYALWLLANGACALLSGTALGSGPIRIGTGPFLGVGAFLIVWLVIWTIGGMAALQEFFRLLCGEDRLLAEGGGLSVVQLRGPFRRRRELSRDTLRRLILTGPQGTLAVETLRGTVPLSNLGTRPEREAAAAALRMELGLRDPEPSSVPTALPRGWEEIITPEGERAVVPDHARRRVQARVAGVGALGLASAAAAMIRQSMIQAKFWPFAVQLLIGMIVLACAAVWLGRGRMEWRIGSGRVTLRRRFGAGVRDVFEAQGFELVLATDRSDHHSDYFGLDAVSGTLGLALPLVTRTGGGKTRKRVTTVARDPSVPRQLGMYLARVGNVPFVDRTTPEARAADLTVLKNRLEQSGPLGRWAVRFVVDVKTRKQG
ncbi:MAG TPA: hypothetical protein VEU09_00165 [Candidatus Binatia bacterium]|nr:hypothetical protein [Candidatus Binatia bacterium]